MSMRPPTAHRHPHSNARQFDLFCDPPTAAAQTPQWQALPAELDQEPAIIVRKPDAATPPTPQDNQLMSKHRVLSLEPHLRLEWRGQDGHNETEQPKHSASLSDSITSSTRIRFSVHTGFSTLIRRINARSSVSICGRPPGERDLQRQ